MPKKGCLISAAALLYLFSLFIVWHIWYWYLSRRWQQWETLFDYSNSNYPVFLYMHWLGGILILLLFPAIYISAKNLPRIHQKLLGYVFLFFGTLPAACGGLGHLLFNDTSPFKGSFFVYGGMLLLASWKVWETAHNGDVRKSC